MILAHLVKISESLGKYTLDSACCLFYLEPYVPCIESVLRAATIIPNFDFKLTLFLLLYCTNDLYIFCVPVFKEFGTT